MGFKPSGSNIVVSTQSFGDADPMVEWLNAHLAVPPLSAGWTHIRDINSEITFFAFSITNGDIAILDGDAYQFYLPPGTGNVLIGAGLNETLTNWGDLVQAQKQWNYEILNVAGNLSIRFFDIPYPGNNLFCNITPSGSVGSYDYIVDGTGTGRTWGGGHEIVSANVTGGIGLGLKLTTVNTFGAMAITPVDDVFIFNGINILSGTWKLISNKYQFFLLIPGSYGNGTFLYAGHLAPARSLAFFNYITGPYNAVAKIDGNRQGLAGIGNTYYCSSGSGFIGHGSSNYDKNPIITVPVYGHGTVSDKAGNALSGLPILTDLSEAMVFDAFLAAPVISGDTIRNVGWIWDALVYSNYLAMDTGSATINGGEIGYVVLSQTGGDAFQGNSQGSLIVQVTT